MRTSLRSAPPLALALALALTLVGCSSQSDGSAGTGEAETTTGADGGNDRGANSPDDGDAEAADAEAPAGTDTATVTIGETTYSFTLTHCQSMMGGLGGNGEASDGSDVRLTISLPPSDGDDLLDTPSITVDEENNRWEADASVADMYPSIEAGDSEVSSFTVDDRRASGTASFVDTYAAMAGPSEAVEGSFEMSCS